MPVSCSRVRHPHLSLDRDSFQVDLAHIPGQYTEPVLSASANGLLASAVQAECKLAS